MIKRLRIWWYFTKLILKGNPVRSWRELENGKFMCDGDCGRWKLHGVCTCGLCHYFKLDHKNIDKIERDQVSWHREAQCEQVMMNILPEEECPHGLSWNDSCTQCHEDFNQAMAELEEEWNRP
jgi:hypothetical protein